MGNERVKDQVLCHLSLTDTVLYLGRVEKKPSVVPAKAVNRHAYSPGQVCIHLAGAARGRGGSSASG